MSPISRVNCRLIYDGLKDCGVRLLAASPANELSDLVHMAEKDPGVILVHVLSEHEGIHVSAGARLAGVKSAILMRSRGFLASIEGIVSCEESCIPLLMLINRDGDFVDSEESIHARCVVEELLRTLHIPWSHLNEPQSVARRIAEAETLAFSENRPVALILSGNLE